MTIFPIILAAGQGTRMRSSIPKVLHPIGGKPMLQHVIESCQQLDVDKIAIVYGHGGEQVQQVINADLDAGNNAKTSTENSAENLVWVQQKEQKGTGHAVAQAESYINDDAVVIIAYGDVPLIKSETLSQLANKLEEAVLVVLTVVQDDPTGYGRIVRNAQGKIESIVEHKDANQEQLQIQEVNTGFIAARGRDLKRWLKDITPNNSQGEYYLTDCIALAVKEGGVVEAVICDYPLEVEGVNDRIQQAKIERAFQVMQAKKLLEAGITLVDPARIDIRGKLEAGKDVSIDVNNVFIGNVELGDRVVIESGCVIKDAQIGNDCLVKANSVIDSAIIENNCDIGPFARVRPDALIKENAKVGNFVEIKKSVIGKGSKVSHLAYIGDTQMGEDVNIGAGTITCNYDGANKHLTTIGDRVFVGSDTQLVAPVTIGNDATIGAGSTINKDAPAGELTLSRSKQHTIKGWQKPQKKPQIKVEKK